VIHHLPKPALDPPAVACMQTDRMDALGLALEL
jgi:hypothetical protein